MFTGIVEEVGIIKEIKKGLKYCKIKVQAKKVLENTNIGDSISVNGVCLTVISMTTTEFTADIVLESLKRSNLGSLKIGSKINLERALSANSRFGGHIVSGHIDCIGQITSIAKDEMAILITIKPSSSVIKYIVEKGSIAIDGISLTVAYVDDEKFLLSIIPHTSSETTLAYKKVGDFVNIECDIVGKYIESFMKFNEKVNEKVIKKEYKINESFLKENGFM
ncbi:MULTISPECIES: riboflavin synthase [unclassified Clostridium]|uniref:riboflavin synthase n=1 Tax=unclassified Clostridium TaxID=2614128 RepID=UPI00189770DC|nr:MULTISPECIES: riboflavin synthase [unclassified Clostridium]MCR1950038.1 riboflavin synthase [Clostridium sp. DSM 100503]